MYSAPFPLEGFNDFCEYSASGSSAERMSRRFPVTAPANRIRSR